MFKHLSNGKVNVGLVQELALNELIYVLEKCEGPKVLLWDESLVGPISLIATPSFLKERNVLRMFPIKKGDLPNIDVRNFIYITRPNLQLMDSISSNIHREERKNRVYQKSFYLFFLPKKSLLCERQLKNNGVYGSFKEIDEFTCSIFPFDNDVISMEYINAYKELYIEGDLTCLHQSATALCTIQKLYGRIPKIMGKGKFAQKVCDLAKTMAFNDNIGNSINDKGIIDQLIILDRSIDIMSALATQLTYEGLIDEFYEINNTTVNLPAEKFTSSPEENATSSALNRGLSMEKKQFILNSKEDLFSEIRDKNFNAVGPVLSRLANQITKAANERHGEKSISELRQFVKNLPSLKANEQSLSVHTTIASMIKDHTSTNEFRDELSSEQEIMMCVDLDKPNEFIENCIGKRESLKTVLRLMCMQSAAGNGLKQKTLDYYKKEIVQTYGIESLLKIGRLEKAGLIKIQTGSRSYHILRKTLNLTVDDFMEVNPKDISYVHSFYAPLTIRIVEHSLKPLGWQGLNDIISAIPEPTFEDYQISNNLVGLSGRRDSLTSELSHTDIPKVILVFFVGGCTFAEISALRFLSQQGENNVEFLIMTTKLINKNSFMNSIIN